MIGRMDITCIFLWFLLFAQIWKSGFSKLVSSRPDVVNVGALISFDSTIGRIARFAMEEAVDDVNSNPSILHGTQLFIKFQNSNCSAFNGIAGAMQFMEMDVVAIIGPQSSVAAHVISYLAKELQVPLLSFAATDPSLSPLQFPYFVRTVPSDSYQMAAVAEMVDYYGWRDVIAIFIDDDFGRNGVASLEDELAERRCRISYKAGLSPLPGMTQDNVRDILVKVAMLESHIIILHVNPDLGFMVFSAANYLGMMGNGYVWIATDWLSSVLDSPFNLPTDIIDSIQGVLVLRHHVPDSPAKREFISMWKKVTHASIGLNSYGFYAYDTVWLLAHAIDAFLNQNGTISFSNDTKLQSLGSGVLHLESMSIFDQGQTLLEKILQTNFVGLTGPVVFDIDRSRVQPAFDIINIIGTGYRQIGYWLNYTGLSTTRPEVLRTTPSNRSTATQQLYSVIWPGGTIIKPRGWVFPNNGKRLRIGVPYRVSFREFVSNVHGTDMFQGFCIDVFTAAVSLLPYAVPFQFIAFGDGRKNPNYNELVNLINTGFFDAVVGDIAIVMNRTKIVDFTQPYAASGLVVVAPFRELNSGAWAFLRPFSPLMWSVTAGFFLVIGFVVWILEHRINDEFRGPPRKQVITILWFSFSTLFFAHREDTRNTLGRAVLIIWLFVVLIINSSYTASLTSILTVQQLLSPFKSIESLKESGEPIGYQVGSFAEYYLEEIGVPQSKLIALGSPEEYVSALRRGPSAGGVAAIVDERPYVELFLSNQCNFKIIGQEFTRSGWGFAFPRDSPLAVDMSTAILQLSESGDLQRIHDKWLMKNGCSSESAEIQSDRLHLKSFVGLFVICALACLAALVIHFMQFIRRFHHAAQGGFHSGRFQTCLSIMDEKKDQSNTRSKGTRAEEDALSSDKENDLGRSPKRRQLKSIGTS